MASVSEYTENLRAEALKFAAQVLKPLAVAAGDHQEVIWDGTAMEDYTEFLNTVQQRFRYNHPDAAQNTHAKLRERVQAYRDGKIQRSELYVKVCILFIGHADLFHQFERLRFINDGREETRREINELRVRVKEDFLKEMNGVLRKCRSVIEKLSETPEKLSHDQLAFIEKTCFSEGTDLNLKFEVMLKLVTNPKRVSYRVLPGLIWRKNRSRFSGCLVLRLTILLELLPNPYEAVKCKWFLLPPIMQRFQCQGS